MPETPTSGARLEVPLPDHIRMSRDGGDLVLDVRWFRPYHVFMLFFSLFWCGLLVFWYGQVLSNPSAPSIMLWFPLLHVGTGIGLSYSTIAGFVNRTRITVGNGAVDVKLGPLPWWGSRRVPAGEIMQVYCEEASWSTGSGRGTTYQVSAITPQSRKLRLVWGLAAADTALYIEQEIEKALGITDRKVPGELPK